LAQSPIAAKLVAAAPFPLFIAGIWVLQSRSVVPFLYFRF
jgi:hypothetical protein